MRFHLDIHKFSLSDCFVPNTMPGAGSMKQSEQVPDLTELTGAQTPAS